MKTIMIIILMSIIVCCGCVREGNLQEELPPPETDFDKQNGITVPSFDFAGENIAFDFDEVRAAVSQYVSMVQQQVP